jgi:hypothetical protein
MVPTGHEVQRRAAEKGERKELLRTPHLFPTLPLPSDDGTIEPKLACELII